MLEASRVPSTYRVMFLADLVDIIVTAQGFSDEEAIDVARLIIESETGFDVGSAMVDVIPINPIVKWTGIPLATRQNDH